MSGCPIEWKRTTGRCPIWNRHPVFFIWLPGQDSNLRPAGYKDSLSFERAWTISSPTWVFREGCRALVRRYWVGSSASSLCTFLPTECRSAGFAQDYRSGYTETASLNSPDVSTTVSCGSCKFYSRLLYQLSYRGTVSSFKRTHSSTDDTDEIEGFLERMTQAD
ncbi:protein of unknown function [Nitrospira japonica]|uniref:Uncharacterized protein n=1 Tax=Nitrospira japonica TaxID=1325564 RepID=A0A1W1I584_9BACT|nr:protein of unknown function [Nitrospira japonica]